MEQMFDKSESLISLDLSNFNTQNVTNMNDMFNGCKSLTNLDLSGFNIKKVNKKINMFKECFSLKDTKNELINKHLKDK